MNTNKLREVLSEMEAERKTLDENIESLRLVIARIQGQSVAPAANEDSAVVPRSYIDDAVELFQAIGKPVHVKDAALRIGQKRGEPVSRASLESTFIRHINKAARPRIAKYGPSMFGLVEWKGSLHTNVEHDAARNTSRSRHDTRESIPERLTAYFKARPGQILKAADLSRELGIPREVVYARLGDLCRKGVVERVEAGAYRLKAEGARQMPVAV